MLLRELLDSSKSESKERRESRKLGRLRRLLRPRGRDSSKLPEWKGRKRSRESSLKGKLPLLSTRRESSKKDKKEN